MFFCFFDYNSKTVRAISKKKRPQGMGRGLNKRVKLTPFYLDPFPYPVVVFFRNRPNSFWIIVKKTKNHLIFFLKIENFSCKKLNSEKNCTVILIVLSYRTILELENLGSTFFDFDFIFFWQIFYRVDWQVSEKNDFRH